MRMKGTNSMINMIYYILSMCLMNYIYSSIQTLLVKLESKDWVSLCESLNTVRQLAIFHKEKLLDML